MQDTKLEDACGSVGDAPKVRLSTKRFLKGHINKVNSVHYSGDSRYPLYFYHSKFRSKHQLIY